MATSELKCSCFNRVIKSRIISKARAIHEQKAPIIINSFGKKVVLRWLWFTPKFLCFWLFTTWTWRSGRCCVVTNRQLSSNAADSFKKVCHLITVTLQITDCTCEGWPSTKRNIHGGGRTNRKFNL